MLALQCCTTNDCHMRIAKLKGALTKMEILAIEWEIFIFPLTTQLDSDRNHGAPAESARNDSDFLAYFFRKHFYVRKVFAFVEKISHAGASARHCCLPSILTFLPMPLFHLNAQAPYRINDPSRIATPRLLIFEDRVARNIQHMRQQLEHIAPGSGFRHLCPHVKTNKSTWITRQLVEAGITDVKVTMREVEVASKAGAKNIFVAYPLLEHEARTLAHLLKRRPEVNFQVQIGSPSHARILQRVAENEEVIWNCFLDVDVGMHRTGMQPENALKTFAEISSQRCFKFAGLHGYDGHIHYPEAERRKAESERAMAKLLDLLHAFRALNVSVERIIVAGSPTFQHDLEILVREINDGPRVQVSPGTWILWDSNYQKMMPGSFEIAALILAQVMDVGSESRITLNLGHKRWAAESGKVELFSRTGMQVVSFSEEHTVLEHAPEEKFEVGDYVLVAPRHVCPTVNLWEDFTLINGEGEIAIMSSPVDGRNR